MKPKMVAFRLAITTLCLLFIAGCNTSVSPSPRPNSTAVSDKHSPTPAPIYPVATVSPIALPSSSPTSSSTPTPIANLTPLATLSPAKAQARVLELLENNSGCKLPCWWGLMPGQTTWQIAQNFLESFASQLYLSGSPHDPLFFADAKFFVPEELFSLPIRQSYAVRDGIVEMIEIHMEGAPEYTSSPYRLFDLLNTYGQPDEILIHTWGTAFDGQWPFGTVLFYSRQGILALYSTQAIAQRNQVQGCPQEEILPTLVLWSPGRNLTIAEIDHQALVSLSEDWWPLRPLSETTSMTIESFYQTFKEPTNAVCIETSAEIWPALP